MASASLRADYVILDSELSMSASPYQKATSGIDAVCQSMESIWAVASTAESHRFAVEALALLIPALPEWVAGNNDMAERVVAGSHLAGRAIDETKKTTGPHAMSYALTKQYGISHGHAVALTFSAFAVAHASAGADKLQGALPPQAHRVSMAALSDAVGLREPSELGDWFRRFCASVNLKLGLHHYGVDSAAYPALAQCVNLERLSNNPIEMSHSDLCEILHRSR